MLDSSARRRMNVSASAAGVPGKRASARRRIGSDTRGDPHEVLYPRNRTLIYDLRAWRSSAIVPDRRVLWHTERGRRSRRDGAVAESCSRS